MQVKRIPLRLESEGNFCDTILYMASYISALTHPSWDLLFLLFVAAVGFFVGAARGKRKLVLMFLALYVARAVFEYLPVDLFAAGRSGSEAVLVRTLAYALCAGIVFFILLRALKGGYDGSWFSALVLGVLLAGFLGAVLFQFLTPEVIASAGISPLATRLFGDPSITRWWMLAPIVGILFL